MLFALIRHLDYQLSNARNRLRSEYYRRFIHHYNGKVGKNFSVRSGGKIHLTKECIFEVGDNFCLGENSDIFVGKNGALRIGNDVFVGKNSTLVANGIISIGSGTQIAHLVTIIDSDHNFSDPKKPLLEQGGNIGKIDIGNEVWIGANSVLLKNIQVGEHAVIGASSVVTKSVESQSVVAGNPAKKLK